MLLRHAAEYARVTTEEKRDCKVTKQSFKLAALYRVVDCSRWVSDASSDLHASTRENNLPSRWRRASSAPFGCARSFGLASTTPAFRHGSDTARVCHEPANVHVLVRVRVRARVCVCMHASMCARTRARVWFRNGYGFMFRIVLGCICRN